MPPTGTQQPTATQAPPTVIHTSTAPETQPPTGTQPPTEPPVTPTFSTCAAPKCDYNGTFYETGDTWVPTDSDGEATCMHCSCTDNGVICEDTSLQCNLTCEGELVRVKGECCPVCKPKNETCLHKSFNTTINVDGCVSDEPVEKTVCSGMCGSKAATIFQAPYMTTDCRCCKPTSMERMTASLTCGNGTSIDYEYVKITSCGCEACQYNPFAPATAVPTQIVTLL